ncbi:CU044_5270 family protein [Actinoplanes sp. NPDC026619]|uniref:CU044_5270 family protein n=1 Tax=Actinoplanes sp. NPDC026619 TaxID=3155798 RepID=UPI0033F21A0D
MNDLELVERFRADLPPADPAALARARARMFRTPPPSAPRRRWVWGLVPAGALAAVGAAVLAGALFSRPQAPTATPPAAHPATSTGAPLVATDAAGVLRLAAAGARTEKALVAKPGQLVYVESIDATDNVENLETKPTWVPPKEMKRQIWLPVDKSSKKGLLRQTIVKTGEVFNVPIDDGTPAYVTKLPTDPKAMRDWLYSYDAGTARNEPDADAWGKIGDTLREQYLPPDAQAAMFEAAATIPGTSLVKQADLAGRKGIAVTRLSTSGQVRFDYIFDAKTYNFLGERVVVVGDLKPYPKGVVSRWTARLQVAIVDRVGQLP